jgi:hypothetical protein
MKRHLLMALVMASMLHTGHATAKATTDVAHGAAEAAKKTTHANQKGASKTADKGEISKLLHLIQRTGSQVGRLFDPSASYSRGAAVRNTCVPQAGKDCL